MAGLREKEPKAFWCVANYRILRQADLRREQPSVSHSSPNLVKENESFQSETENLGIM